MFPLILGREFCGFVKNLGDEVRTDIQIVDKVWGLVPIHMQGSHAQYVVVNESSVRIYLIILLSKIIFQ